MPYHWGEYTVDKVLSLALVPGSCCVAVRRDSGSSSEAGYADEVSAACYSDPGTDTSSEFSMVRSVVSLCSEASAAHSDSNFPLRCDPLAALAVEPFQPGRPNGDFNVHPIGATTLPLGALPSSMVAPPLPPTPPSGGQNPLFGQTQQHMPKTEPTFNTEPLASTQIRHRAAASSRERTHPMQTYLTAGGRQPLGVPNPDDVLNKDMESPQAYMIPPQPVQHQPPTMLPQPMQHPGVPQAGTGFLDQGVPPPASESFQGSVPAEVTGPDGPLVCPLCNRQCQSHHRLGLFWRKFGYNGPAYCSRCSSVFRAHMVTRTVSNDMCTRDQPCERCELILSAFKTDRQEAFAAMDRCEAKKPQVEKEPLPEEVIPCPHCDDRLPSNKLGLFWRKFGYRGKPYCANCSAKFRNHIIRQRITKTKDCSRAAPCTVCDSILHSFGPERDTTFNLIDSKSRAPQHGAAAANASGTGSGNTSGRGGATPLEALAAKRRKLSDCTTTGALAGALPLAIMGMLAFCAVTGLVAWWSSDDPEGAAIDSSVHSALWCSGVDQPRGMVQSKFSACYGPPLSTCEYLCFEAYDPVGNLTCLPGKTEFTGGKCVPSYQRAIEALAMNQLTKNMYIQDRGWCKGGATRGMVEDEVDACFGEPGSTCSYSCKPGFMPNGTLTCYDEEQVYTGGHCEPDAAGALDAAEALDAKDSSDLSNARATDDDPVVVQ